MELWEKVEDSVFIESSKITEWQEEETRILRDEDNLPSAGIFILMNSRFFKESKEPSSSTILEQFKTLNPQSQSLDDTATSENKDVFASPLKNNNKSTKKYFEPVRVFKENQSQNSSSIGKQPKAPSSQPQIASDNVTSDRVDMFTSLLGSVKESFKKQFLFLIHDSYFEYGFSNAAEEFAKENLDRYGSFAREWINDCFLTNFANEEITSKILRVLSHFEYDQAGSPGVTMCFAALSHKSVSVKENAIRTIENWENPELIEGLKKVAVKEEWLQEYLSQVILDLEELSSGSVC